MFNWLTKRKATRAVQVVDSTEPPALAPSPSEAKRIEGNVHLERNQLDAAAACYQEAIELDDRSVPARVNLAYVLLELQRHQEAEVHLLQAVAINERNVDAIYMLGSIARSRGDMDAAIAHFEKAISLQPDFEQAYRDACLACAEGGQSARAEALLRRGVQVLPASADLHFLLGNVFQAAGQSDSAIESYRRALAVRQDLVEAHSNIALVLRSVGQLDQAAAHLQRVAAFRPAEFDAHFQYGVALQSLERIDEAIESFRRAVAVDPESAVGLSSLGSVLAAKGHSDEAIAHYHRAIAADKTHYFAYAGLGVELNEQGRPSEAIKSLRRALSLNPTGIESHSSILFLMSFVAEPIEYLQEARRYGDKVAGHARPLSPRNVQTAASRATLRVGLVSGDLRAHPVAAFLEGVLANLDRQRVEIRVYTTTRRDDEVTARLRRHCAAWSSIVGMHDEAAAQRIHEDGIDVLIDLAGHTAHNRLSVFAWRPAPVQVTWLGYLASTGLSSMNYVLADRISLPEENQRQFVEQTWYMPNSLYCFTPPSLSPAVGQLPALLSGGVTFGSFQRMNKISDATLDAWVRVLQRVANARLRIQCKQMADAQLRARFIARLLGFGIPMDRVTLVGPVPDRVAYLACHDHVDIVLDTFPYPGITTTCEALWMGVPTVTLAGNTLLSRQGASLLHCVDLDDWIASDAADYVSRAVRHADDLEVLARLRAGLRDRARTSPLFDAQRFARDLELALHSMWERSPSDHQAMLR